VTNRPDPVIYPSYLAMSIIMAVRGIGYMHSFIVTDCVVHSNTSSVTYVSCREESIQLVTFDTVLFR